MKPFHTTQIAKNFQHKDREAIIKYVDLMCNKNSDMNSIVNLEERKKVAMAKAKWAGTTEKELQEMVEELIFHYLSYYQADNDFSLLLSREELYAQMLKAIREPVVNITDEDKYMKTIKLKGDIDSLLEKLNNGIQELRIKIYGGHKETAQEKIKKILTPEMRLEKKA